MKQKQMHGYREQSGSRQKEWGWGVGEIDKGD